MTASSFRRGEPDRRGSRRHFLSKLGEVAVSETPSRERRVPVRLSNEEKIKVEEYVKNVQDDEAREVIKRVIEKDMMIRKKKT